MTLELKFYEYMRSLPHIKSLKMVSVAVSGGVDSIVLTDIASQYAQESGIKLVCLSVDHKLRHDSTHQLHELHAYLSQRGIEHHILPWEHSELITTAVQQKARLHRYKLLTEWCERKNVGVLLTAHHLDDQFETFIMRLSKGSGLRGLGAMRQETKRHQASISIIRPFLDIPKKDIINYANQRKLPVWQDSSNENLKFLRAKIRKNQSTFSDMGFSLESFNLTLLRLQEAQKFIERSTAAACDKLNITTEEAGVSCDLVKLQQIDPYLLCEVLLSFIENFHYRFVRKESLNRLVEFITCDTTTLFTLAHLIWRKKKGRLIITREQR